MLRETSSLIAVSSGVVGVLGVSEVNPSRNVTGSHARARQLAGDRFSGYADHRSAGLRHSPPAGRGERPATAINASATRPAAEPTATREMRRMKRWVARSYPSLVPDDTPGTAAPPTTRPRGRSPLPGSRRLTPCKPDHPTSHWQPASTIPRRFSLVPDRRFREPRADQAVRESETVATVLPRWVRVILRGCAADRCCGPLWDAACLC